MQRLHDALSKLAPKSKVGGLGLAAGSSRVSAVNKEGLPNNGMHIYVIDFLQ